MTHHRYVLHRDRDPTGVSGTGVVAEAVRFSDGTTVVRWLGADRSTVVWPDLDTARRVHGHDGATRFIDIDAEIDGEPD